MTQATKPTIGPDLMRQLDELIESARLHAAATRSYQAGALSIVLAALRAQAEDGGSHVTVTIRPREVA